MPMIDADGCLLNVSVDGRDSGPTLMLSNALGCTLQMWEPQMATLSKLFRIVRYDRRGHGRSGAPPGPYSMERFARDVLAILDDLNIARAHWCGLSMGGMVGQWLGANAPERFDRIILANTNCYYPNPTNWHARINARTLLATGPATGLRNKKARPPSLQRLQANWWPGVGGAR